MQVDFTGTRFLGDGRVTIHPQQRDGRSLNIKRFAARKLIQELADKRYQHSTNSWHLWVMREWAVAKELPYEEEVLVNGTTTFTLTVKAATTKQNLDPYDLAECAIHLWTGYATEVLKTQDYPTDNLDGVSAIAKFAPVVCAKLEGFDTNDWGKVWHYEVTQELGAWLSRNPKATNEQFAAQMLTFINLK
jgi:hypothetical protein